jgi:hypothetical protein
MRRIFIIGGLLAAGAAAVSWWRDHRRFAASYVNRVIDPWLVRRGIVTKSEGELGLLEHIGRKSATVRVTPVHPVLTPTGFRIIVPLAAESHWAQNVLAAGGCRLQVGNQVFELDEPSLVVPSAIDDLPVIGRRVLDWLGFRYLLLRRVAQHPGTLDAGVEPAGSRPPAEPEAIAVA